MHYIIHLLLTTFLLFSASCCRLRAANSDSPQRPSIQSSWKESQENGFTTTGPLILNRDESTDNGKIGIRLHDVIPAKCSSPFAEYAMGPEAVLQFYKPSTKEVLGEAKFSRGNSPLDGSLASKIDYDGLEVIEINSEEKWVEFDLRSVQIDPAFKLRPQGVVAQKTKRRVSS